MTIRDAAPAEYEAIARLWETSVRATHDFIAEDDIVTLRPRLVAEWLPAVTVRVHVDDDGHIQDFVGVAGRRIEMLFIAPRARGMGVGRALLEHALAHFGATHVDVNEQDIGAIGFYQRMGFEVFDRSPLDGQGKPYPLLHMRLAALDAFGTPASVAGPVA